MHPRGRIVPNYAAIDRDDRIPFWRKLGERVHEHDCRFIVQLAHAGAAARHPRLRARRRAGALVDEPLRRAAASGAARRRSRRSGSSRRRSPRARGARAGGASTASRSTARTATASAVPLVRDQRARRRDYGGAREPGAPADRDRRGDPREVGDDFHLQVKISATELGNALMPWAKKGNTIADSVQVAKWLEAAGADAIHVSREHLPAPGQPRGGLQERRTSSRPYDTCSPAARRRSGTTSSSARGRSTRSSSGARAGREQLEAASLDDARRIKERCRSR